MNYVSVCYIYLPWWYVYIKKLGRKQKQSSILTSISDWILNRINCWWHPETLKRRLSLELLWIFQVLLLFWSRTSLTSVTLVLSEQIKRTLTQAAIYVTTYVNCYCVGAQMVCSYRTQLFLKPSLFYLVCFAPWFWCQRPLEKFALQVSYRFHWSSLHVAWVSLPCL